MKWETYQSMKCEMMRMCNCNIADTAGSWNEEGERTLRSMGGILINNCEHENYKQQKQ